MADLINLNRIRKHKKKELSLRQAEMNRLKFGRTKPERERIELEAYRSAKVLDQHELLGDAT